MSTRKNTLKIADVKNLFLQSLADVIALNREKTKKHVLKVEEAL